MNENKKKKSNIAGYVGFILTAVIIAAVVTFITHREKDTERTALAKQIAEYGPRRGVPKSIDELKRVISVYEKMIELHIRDASQTSAYWKILGTRFREKEMHIEAMDAFEHAIQYSPNDETLHYLMGLSASQAAKSMYDTYNRIGEGERLYNTAEKALLRAVELEQEYAQARYALAVLYAYELNRPSDSISQLSRYMEQRPQDAEAMFIMARACFMTNEYQKAIEWYNRGIPLSKDKNQITDAEANIAYIRSLR
jgi:tetratricopeptide (TPR) repeat protein